jgi:hypothetical protein
LKISQTEKGFSAQKAGDTNKHFVPMVECENIKQNNPEMSAYFPL